ncbi:MAG: response regulator [Alphaproteobacteria bacterium]|nr:response regulator [Alphaproteobacteria bacterium]
MFGRNKDKNKKDKPPPTENEPGDKARLNAQKLEALGLFAGGIAHDFNNILSIIEGYANVALRQQREEGKTDPATLEKIVNATQRGAGLTRQLLAFGRQQITPTEKTDLAAELRAQAALIRPLLGENVTLSLALPKTGLWMMGARDHITQILLNLALNARDAMPRGGTVIVSALQLPDNRLVPRLLREKFPDTPFIHLRFTDDGTGIPPDVLPHIFDPFFTTKDQGLGTGLGLCVVYGIVDQLGGTVEVSSREGKGTQFDIFLPAATPAEERKEEAAAAHEPAAQPLAGRTILIAEDEPELRDVLTVIFSGMNMHVLTASNGNHALQVQEDYDGDIDFLLADVVMPEMDGVQLAERFSRLRPGANVVYMSGYPFMDNRKDIKLPDDADFLPKPLREDRLRQILERALARRDARRQRDTAQGTDDLR